MSFTSRGTCTVASLKVSAMIVYDMVMKVLDKKSFSQHNTAGLISAITFVLFSQKPLWWKEINTHPHPHTHPHTPTHPPTHTHTHTHIHTPLYQKSINYLEILAPRVPVNKTLWRRCIRKILLLQKWYLNLIFNNPDFLEKV